MVVKDRVASVMLVTIKEPMDKASTTTSTSGLITQQQGFSEVTDITSPVATAKWDARMVEGKKDVELQLDSDKTRLSLHVMSYCTPYRIEHNQIAREEFWTTIAAHRGIFREQDVALAQLCMSRRNFH